MRKQEGCGCWLTVADQQEESSGPGNARSKNNLYNRDHNCRHTDAKCHSNPCCYYLGLWSAQCLAPDGKGAMHYRQTACLAWHKGRKRGLSSYTAAALAATSAPCYLVQIYTSSIVCLSAGLHHNFIIDRSIGYLFPGFNKKPGFNPGFYDFDQSRRPTTYCYIGWVMVNAPRISPSLKPRALSWG